MLTRLRMYHRALASFRGYVRPQVEDRIWEHIRDQVWDPSEDQVWIRVRLSLMAALGETF